MKKKNTGLTLVEIIVTVGVFSIIAVAVTKFMRDTFYFQSIFTGGLTASDNARGILQPLSNEVRSMSPSSLGGYPIEQAVDNTFIFYADLDDDGYKERVRYQLSGTSLIKGVTKISNVGTAQVTYNTATETTTTVVRNIRNGSVPVFQYYDSSYDGTTGALVQPVSVTAIRLVKITFYIDVDTGRSPTQTVVTTQISLRNVKDNL